MHICYFIGIEAQQRERGCRKDGANGGRRRLQNRQDTSLLLRHVISLRGSQLTPRYLVGTYTFLLLRLATRSLARVIQYRKHRQECKAVVQPGY